MLLELWVCTDQQKVEKVTILTLRVLSTNHGADLWENIDDFALGASQARDLMKISKYNIIYNINIYINVVKVNSPVGLSLFFYNTEND